MAMATTTDALILSDGLEGDNRNGAEDVLLPSLSMQDDLGIVYVIETPQQFWSELEDMLIFPKDEPPTLSFLDSTLRRFLALCAVYHEEYLQTPLQLHHACELILDSELFSFHSERMCEIIIHNVGTATDPHFQFIYYHVLLCYGQRKPDFFRSQKRWQPLIPLVMDHVLVEIDPDVEDTYFNNSGGSRGPGSVPIAIEANLRSLGIGILYEVCRVQKLGLKDLRMFGDSFLDYLFELVEQTRHMQDETFNYSVIKLIVSLNEQFMVASFRPDAPPMHTTDVSESENRVLRVLMRRLGESKTFGENMIFMLNRAERTPEDLCMQLLILKLLYVLFSTKGSSEYFYTNDLKVLVDVFLRELVDLDEESESLRHTYLRVLFPLLTKTQLRSVPYKRPQIVNALESLLRNTSIRDANPTTKRLVERCLSGEWCDGLRKLSSTTAPAGSGGATPTTSSPGTPTFGTSSEGPLASPIDAPSVLNAVPEQPQYGVSSVSASSQLERTASLRAKALKASKSVENLRKASVGSEGDRRMKRHSPPPPPPPLPSSVVGSHPKVNGLEPERRPSDASTLSVANASAPSSVSVSVSSSSSSTIGRPTSSSSIASGSRHRPPPPPRSHRSPPHHPHHNSLDSASSISSSSASSVSSVSSISSFGSSATSGSVTSTSTNGSVGTSTSALSNGSNGTTSGSGTKHRRTAPPIPQRRKPPAVPASKGGLSPPPIPVQRTASGTTLVTVKSTITGGSLIR